MIIRLSSFFFIFFMFTLMYLLDMGTINRHCILSCNHWQHQQVRSLPRYRGLQNKLSKAKKKKDINKTTVSQVFLAGTWGFDVSWQKKKKKKLFPRIQHPGCQEKSWKTGDCSCCSGSLLIAVTGNHSEPWIKIMVLSWSFSIPVFLCCKLLYCSNLC